MLHDESLSAGSRFCQRLAATLAPTLAGSTTLACATGGAIQGRSGDSAAYLFRWGRTSRPGHALLPRPRMPLPRSIPADHFNRIRPALGESIFNFRRRITLHDESVAAQREEARSRTVAALHVELAAG